MAHLIGQLCNVFLKNYNICSQQKTFQQFQDGEKHNLILNSPKKYTNIYKSSNNLLLRLNFVPLRGDVQKFWMVRTTT